MKCKDCHFYIALNELNGDCTVNTPMWVPNFIARDDSVIRGESRADDCNCFVRAKETA